MDARKTMSEVAAETRLAISPNPCAGYHGVRRPAGLRRAAGIIGLASSLSGWTVGARGRQMHGKAKKAMYSDVVGWAGWAAMRRWVSDGQVADTYMTGALEPCGMPGLQQCCTLNWILTSDLLLGS
jgi:hypothetical protein